MAAHSNPDLPAAQTRSVSRVGLASIAVPCAAYLLTVLPYLGVKSALLFYVFATLTRVVGAGVGVVLGIVACVNAPDWQSAKVGFIGIAIGVCAFVAAILVALQTNG
jgi:hypothetical protein